MVEHFGLRVHGHVQDNAEESVRRVIEVLTDGIYLSTDNGSVIQVAIAIDKSTRSARIDFTGTSPPIVISMLQLLCARQRCCMSSVR